MGDLSQETIMCTERAQSNLHMGLTILRNGMELNGTERNRKVPGLHSWNRIFTAHVYVHVQYEFKSLGSLGW